MTNRPVRAHTFSLVEVVCDVPVVARDAHRESGRRERATQEPVGHPPVPDGSKAVEVDGCGGRRRWNRSRAVGTARARALGPDWSNLVREEL